MSSGLAIRSTAGGFIARQFVTSFGWEAIFIFGGLLPILLASLLIVFLPESRALTGLPGRVESAGFVTDLPLAGGNTNGGVNIEESSRGMPNRPQGTSPGIDRTMHIPILRGREFSDADRLSAPHVAIINDSFARKYFPTKIP